MVAATERAPLFWLRLARVRRAAAQLRQAPALSELAHSEGFADQAHMTREFRRWLKVTPGQLRGDERWAARHLGPGYGV